MAAVQRTLGAVDREVDVRIAAHTKDRLLPARLVDWSIADVPGVGVQQILVQRDDFAKVGRARFLLAFEKESDVRGRLDLASFKRSERSQNGHHSSLIIRS